KNIKVLLTFFMSSVDGGKESMSTQSHYFIAVPIKERLKEQLSTWQKNLQPLLTYKQWPHKDDLHITLKFLGAIGADQIQNVQHAFKRLESLDAFSVRAKGIGTFGQPDKRADSLSPHRKCIKRFQP